MESKNKNLTKQDAINILNNTVSVTKQDLVAGKVKVTSISPMDFKWSNPIDPEQPFYRIVNTNILTEYGKKCVYDDMRSGKYNEACNHTLSFNASPELAKKLLANKFANAEFRLVDNKDGIEIQVIKSLTPCELEAAKKSFWDFDEKTEDFPDEIVSLEKEFEEQN